MTIEKLEKANVLNTKINKLKADIDKLLVLQESNRSASILCGDGVEVIVDLDSLGYIIQGLNNESLSLQTEFKRL